MDHLVWFLHIVRDALDILQRRHRGPKAKYPVMANGDSHHILYIFCSFVGHNLKKNIQDWLSPVIFVGLTALLTFAYQDVTAEVVAMGLRGFNVGGNKNILISQEGTQEPIKGKLTLLSPRNAYLKDSNGRLKIIPVTDRTTLEIW
ncbi:hypothetical protein V2J66_00565 [Pseudomonas alliivorans]|nr:hypothetical protein [Pseudomonas alliivorans]MEE5166310.1 hypothetical protein [Pseudomonas alliivorans]